MHCRIPRPWRTRSKFWSALIAVLFLTSIGAQSMSAATLQLDVVATGFRQPLFVTAAGGDSTRLFVVEKPGRIRVVKEGEVLAKPFLDITRIVNDNANERGLLGLAFHPDYESNGWFYVHYTNRRGDIVIARYAVSGDPDHANAGSAKVILKIRHRRAANHNGGMLAFGPNDGYLYVAVGDGGAGQSANGQKTTTLLGKILRIDVDRAAGGRAYAIPADNPFAESRRARPEIWAYGLRNPFRFSFDRETGDIFIGEVGQQRWEEIDSGESGQGGINYGWAIMEGAHCYKRATNCPTDGLHMPVFEYSHAEGNVVTGGYVYRGSAISSLIGTYVFTDFGSREIWGLTRDQNGNWMRSVLIRSDTNHNIASFGVNAAGELFAVDLVAGVLYQLNQA